MGIGLGNRLCHMVEILKWIPPTSKLHVGHKNKNSIPMGIGLGIDYVTWWEILNGSPPHQNFMWDTK